MRLWALEWNTSHYSFTVLVDIKQFWNISEVPVPLQFSESLTPVSTACPVIESMCQGSAAPLVPVLPCKLVLLAAGGGGGGALSDDYFYLRSHRGQALFARHCANAAWYEMQTQCKAWRNPLVFSAIEIQHPNLIPLSIHVCQWCHRDVKLCICCCGCC